MVKRIEKTAGSGEQDRLDKKGQFAKQLGEYGFFVATRDMAQVETALRQSDGIQRGFWYMGTNRQSAGSSPIHWTSDVAKIAGLYEEFEQDNNHKGCLVTVEFAKRLLAAKRVDSEFVAYVEGCYGIKPDADSTNAASKAKTTKTAK